MTVNFNSDVKPVFVSLIPASNNEELGNLKTKLSLVYDKIDHYRFVHPLEVSENDGSITSVLTGTRPFGVFMGSDMRIYAEALESIDGIFIEKIPTGKGQPECWAIYRKGSEELCRTYLKLNKILQARWKKEGNSRIAALKRIIYSYREQGRLFSYNPEAIEAFGKKVKEMLKSEEANQRRKQT